MAILKMKKIRLCGIAEEQDQLIRELQLLGSVEIGSPEALTEAQQTAGKTRRMPMFFSLW